MASENRGPARCLVAIFAAVAALAIAGCAARTAQSDVRDFQQPWAGRAAQSSLEPASAGSVEARDYDPWEPFNERVFWLNYHVVDRFVMKPVAIVWRRAVPDPITQGLTNAFDNLEMPKRFVNNVLQGRIEGAARELARFTINSTAGIAGIFDIATIAGIDGSYADTGQTLGSYGIGPGPYLVLPLMQPLTVRDGIGYGFDVLLDPVGYFAPFAANMGRSLAKRVNQRAANLELYQDAEESTLDLYAAVRNGYLQRRAKSIRHAIRERAQERETEWSALYKTLFGVRGVKPDILDSTVTE